jgi:hypothetical protein
MLVFQPKVLLACRALQFWLWQPFRIISQISTGFHLPSEFLLLQQVRLLAPILVAVNDAYKHFLLAI